MCELNTSLPHYCTSPHEPQSIRILQQEIYNSVQAWVLVLMQGHLRQPRPFGLAVKYVNTGFEPLSPTLAG